MPDTKAFIEVPLSFFVVLKLPVHVAHIIIEQTNMGPVVFSLVHDQCFIEVFKRPGAVVLLLIDRSKIAVVAGQVGSVIKLLVDR